VGALMMAGAFGAFEVAMAQGASLELARTVVVNAFVAMEIGYLFNCRSLDRSMLSVGVFSNHWLLWGVAIMAALQVVFTYLPLMNTVFQSAPMPAGAWVAITVLGVAVYAIVGLEKWWTGRRKRATASRLPAR
jgi:magnesium-transporting ATPase (P-type)